MCSLVTDVSSPIRGGQLRLAIFSDIHANLHALHAVLDDIARHQPDAVYCLGDLVGYGAFPNEVIALLRERQIPTIMGNYDDGVGFDRDDCGCAYKTAEMRRLGDLSLQWTKGHVTAENKAFLRSLLPNIRLEITGKRALLVHGSPRKINEYLFEERPDAGLDRLLDMAQADVLVCGHTHMPYHRVLPNGRHVVNDGSVGKPKDGDSRAGYAVLEAEGRDLRVTFVRVAYDVERTARAIEASTLPHEFAAKLRAATG